MSPRRLSRTQINAIEWHTNAHKSSPDYQRACYFSAPLYRLCGHVCVVDGYTWILVSCLRYNKPCREIGLAKKGRYTHAGKHGHTHTHTRENFTTLQEITTKQCSFKSPKLAQAHRICTDMLSCPYSPVFIFLAVTGNIFYSLPSL